MKTIAKPGRHGTLYLYELTYTQDDPGYGVATTRLWAYSPDHAVDKFYNSLDADGWRVLRVAAVPANAGMHRAQQREV